MVRNQTGLRIGLASHHRNGACLLSLVGAHLLSDLHAGGDGSVAHVHR